MTPAADRRGLNAGIALVVIGLYVLLRRELHVRGPGPLLLLIGTALLLVSAMRGFRGPVVPAGVLLGLGLGFVLRDPLSPWMPGWATLLLGLGAGLLGAAALQRSAGDRRGPLLPAIVLIAIALAAGFAQNFAFPELLAEQLWRLWPWALVIGGVILVLQALRARKV